nr:MAG TPA: hypothetical protein [Caudoviricetes sp.]
MILHLPAIGNRKFMSIENKYTAVYMWRRTA